MTTNNKLNPRMKAGPGIEPGSHWWEASFLTIASFLLPKSHMATDYVRCETYENK